MSEAAHATSQTQVPLRCPKCNERGWQVWEMGGGEPVLVSLSAGFYERVARGTKFAIELVCGQCGTVQPKGEQDQL